MFWWPGPGSLALLLTLTEVPLSPTTSQTLRATTLYQPSCCFSRSLFASWVLQSLLCVCPPLLSVGHRWTPYTSRCQAFLSVRSCGEERDDTVEMRGLAVWRNSRSAESFWAAFPFVGSTFQAFFPYLKFVVFVAHHVPLHHTVHHCIHLK